MKCISNCFDCTLTPFSCTNPRTFGSRTFRCVSLRVFTDIYYSFERHVICLCCFPFLIISLFGEKFQLINFLQLIKALFLSFLLTICYSPPFIFIIRVGVIVSRSASLSCIIKHCENFYLFV